MRWFCANWCRCFLSNTGVCCCEYVTPTINVVSGHFNCSQHHQYTIHQHTDARLFMFIFESIFEFVWQFGWNLRYWVATVSLNDSTEFFTRKVPNLEYYNMINLLSNKNAYKNEESLYRVFFYIGHTGLLWYQKICIVSQYDLTISKIKVCPI